MIACQDFLRQDIEVKPAPTNDKRSPLRPRKGAGVYTRNVAAS